MGCGGDFLTQDDKAVKHRKEAGGKALKLLGYTEVKEGVWKHPYFTQAQHIRTDDPDNTLWSLVAIFKQWGREEAQREIREPLGIK